jgi:hypothetical protein
MLATQDMCYVSYYFLYDRKQVVLTSFNSQLEMLTFVFLGDSILGKAQWRSCQATSLVVLR